ncbi:MAG: RimK family protein [Phycisphaerales bacterium JB050]
MTSLIVVDNPKRWTLHIDGAVVVSSRDYLTGAVPMIEHGAKVFNLCRSYRYQSAGYYVSLLAEARGQRPLPAITAIQDLKLTPVVRLVSQELDELVQTSLHRIKSEEFELSIYFGRNMAKQYDKLANALFNAFPAPMIRARFEHNGVWRLAGVRAIALGEVPETHRPFLVEQAEKSLKRAPRKAKPETAFRFDLAILHDPHEDMSPSCPDALKRFIKAGESMGIRCELIEKDAYGRLAEFDGLFIRVTTAVNHYTYRFARRAAAEGLVVIDDPVSIVRCTNKVYLAETLARHRIATPKTVTFAKDGAASVPAEVGLPCVVKKPDSSFSVGVLKASDEAEFKEITDRLFEETDLLVAQEFVPTDFDWRIGVLGGEPLYACRYFMASGHWQIVKREDDGEIASGEWQTVPLSETPDSVVKLATRTAELIGDGLYGVDIKVVRGKPVVMEINDNPTLDDGVEDQVIGNRLYERIMNHFLVRMEARRS